MSQVSSLTVFNVTGKTWTPSSTSSGNWQFPWLTSDQELRFSKTPPCLLAAHSQTQAAPPTESSFMLSCLVNQLLIMKCALHVVSSLKISPEYHVHYFTGEPDSVQKDCFIRISDSAVSLYNFKVLICISHFLEWPFSSVVNAPTKMCSVATAGSWLSFLWCRLGDSGHSNKCSNKRCQYYKSQLNPLCHKTIPDYISLKAK